MVYLKKAARRLKFLWIFLLLIFLVSNFLLSAIKFPVKADPPSASPNLNMMIPMGTVNATAISGETIYVGGDFTEVCYYSHGLGFADETTAGIDKTFPKITGEYSYVSALISDGSGGWYMAGQFYLEDSAIENLVHIKSDKTIDSVWNPAPDNGIATLTLSGTTLYVGGSFHNIGGQTRNHIAAVSTITGNATAWNPNALTEVKTMALSDTTLYVGGLFHSIGGQTRNHIAALDTTTDTNNATAWNPNAGDEVLNILLSGNTLYTAGKFTTIGGQTRNRIAALDTTTDTNNATSWNPDSGNWVYAMYLDGITMYVGGAFTTIGGQSRNYIAALDTTTDTNNATAWNPSADDRVRAIYLSGTTVYAGGDFTSIGGQSRTFLAALSPSSNNALSWYPGDFGPALDEVDYLTVIDSLVVAGGAFDYFGCQDRTNLAALDTTTGDVLDWTPNPNGIVSSLAIDSSTLYVGGTFTTIGGQTLTNLASVNTSTGLADETWNPNPDGIVRALAYDSSKIYIGGDFLNIDSQNVSYLAALTKTTGAIDLTWDSDANGLIRTIVVSGSTIYVGGGFTNIGGQARNYLAALNSSAQATSWNPALNSDVYTIALQDSIVYVGGSFWTVGGLDRYSAAAIDADGNPTAWDADITGNVYTMVIDESTVYLAGDITSLKDTTDQVLRNSIAAMTSDGVGEVLEWDPNLNDVSYGVLTLAFSGSTLYAGGDFLNVGTLNRPYFVQFGDGVAPVVTPTPTPTPTSAVLASVGSLNKPSDTYYLPVCNAPSSAPILFRIKRTGNSATLYFAPAAEPVTTYHVQYGKTPAADQYAVSFEKPYTGAVIVYKIHGLSKRDTYYFRVQGLSSCNASSSWSDTIGSTDYEDEILPTPTVSGLPPLAEIVDQITPMPTLTGTQPLEIESASSFSWFEDISTIISQELDSEEVKVLVKSAAVVASNTTEFTAVFGSTLVAATAATSLFVNLGTITTAVSLVQAPLKIPAVIKLFSSMREILVGLFFPILGFFRKKQKTLGIVIDSVTGKPISSAYLVIFSPSGNLFTTMTNKDGRFFFSKVKPDTYKLRAEMSGFKFPSQILTVNQNSNFTHIYRGEDLSFSQEMPFSNLAVPLDPNKSLSLLRKLNLKFKTIISFIFVRYFYSISLVFFGLAIFAYLFSKSNLQLLLAAISLAFIVFNIVKDIRNRQNTGLVVDGRNKPLVGLNIELYRNNEFYSSTITDSAGRFMFAPEEGDFLLKVGNWQKEIIINQEHLWVTEKIVLTS